MFGPAQWIWCPGLSGINLYADFFTPFSVSGAGDPLLLHISAEHQYAAFVNGTFAASGQYTDLPQSKVYQTHDISPAAAPGENQLWVRVYYQGTDSLTWQSGCAGLLFAIEEGGAVVCASGPQTLCAPAPAYDALGVARLTTQLGFSFTYHQQREWPAPVPHIALCRAVPAPRTGSLKPRAIPHLILRAPAAAAVQSQGVFFCGPPGRTPGDACQYAALAYREREDLFRRAGRPALPDARGLSFEAAEGDGVYLLLDLGEPLCGLLTLELDLPAGTRVDVAFGEHLEDLRVRSGVGGRSFCALYYAAAGRRSFTHWFKRLGARYLQLYIHARRGAVHYAGLRPVEYPVDPGPQLACGDRLHTAVFNAAKATLHNCMHEHFEDCPWREQALYAMDSRLQMLCAYYAFGEYRLARESIRLLGQSLRPDGLLELCSPGKDRVTIPSFTLAWPCQLADYVLFSGDVAFGEEMLPTALRIAQAALGRVAASGLVPAYTQPGCWNFYEWSPGLDGGEIHRTAPLPARFDAPLSAFLILALQSISRLCGWLGKPDAAAGLDAAADRLGAALEAFWNESAGCYAAYLSPGGSRTHYAQLTQALILCSGACPAPRRSGLARRLLQGEGLLPLTLSSCFFRYEALLSEDGLAPAVFDEIARRWGGMLLNGARTFWETERGAEDFHRAGSLCHGWSAIPIYFYFAYGLGIRPTQPGFSAYVVAPAHTGVSFPSGSVLTPGGLLSIP